MANFKGWTSDKVEALSREMSARNIDRKEAARKATAHKKNCLCDDCSAKYIAQMSDEDFEKNLNRLQKARIHNSQIIDDLVDSVDRKALKKVERRMLKEMKPKESANQITANLIRAINMQPRCVAYRINNVGVWDAAKGVYRAGNTQKGIFDIAAIMRGRPIWLEVKAGRDKPSQDQLLFQQEVRLSGGVAEFVYSTDEGMKVITKLISETWK